MGRLYGFCDWRYKSDVSVVDWYARNAALRQSRLKGSRPRSSPAHRDWDFQIGMAVGDELLDQPDPPKNSIKTDKPQSA
jgi:hypothetical protein